MVKCLSKSSDFTASNESSGLTETTLVDMIVEILSFIIGRMFKFKTLIYTGLRYETKTWQLFF